MRLRTDATIAPSVLSRTSGVSDRIDGELEQDERWEFGAEDISAREPRTGVKACGLRLLFRMAATSSIAVMVAAVAAAAVAAVLLLLRLDATDALSCEGGAAAVTDGACRLVALGLAGGACVLEARCGCKR